MVIPPAGGAFADVARPLIDGDPDRRVRQAAFDGAKRWQKRSRPAAMPQRHRRHKVRESSCGVDHVLDIARSGATRKTSTPVRGAEEHGNTAAILRLKANRWRAKRSAWFVFGAPSICRIKENCQGQAQARSQASPRLHGVGRFFTKQVTAQNGGRGRRVRAKGRGLFNSSRLSRNRRTFFMTTTNLGAFLTLAMNGSRITAP